MALSIIPLHEQLALLNGTSKPMMRLQASSALSNPVASRVAQLLEFEAELQATKRAIQPSSWLLQSLLGAAMISQKHPYVLLNQFKLPTKSLPSRSASPVPSTIKLPCLPMGAVSNSLTKTAKVVDQPSDVDILCGRGGKSNHHAGNKKYRQVISTMKARYRTIDSKHAKTDLSKAIIEHVFSYGGRFLKLDKKTGKYCVLSSSEARKKTSQALREAKEVKWTR